MPVWRVFHCYPVAQAKTMCRFGSCPSAGDVSRSCNVSAYLFAWRATAGFCPCLWWWSVPLRWLCTGLYLRFVDVTLPLWSSKHGRGFDESNLRHMRNFYLVYPKCDALRPELSWTHYRLLLKVGNGQARLFYMQETIDCNWSTRTLERQIGNLYYERMLMSHNTQIVKDEAAEKEIRQEPKDIIKDPYVLEFLGLKDNTDFRENELEQAIIDKLQNFLQELGKGFAFVGRQYRLTTDTGKHFYADLVFYNYILKFFLIIDLKAEPLTHQDIGQMDMYVRYFEEKMRQETDNPTIGLILCTEKDKTIVKYSLLNDSNQIFASKYMLYLPTEQELKKEIERQRVQIEQERKLNQ